MNTVPCPHCGGEIRADAKACRHCGSSDSDGWRDEDEHEDDGDEDFDYDSFVEENLSPGLTNTKTAPLWRFVAAMLLLAIIIWLLQVF